MKKHVKVIAVDLGASGGKLFAGVFENDSFSLEEIHRFSHEAISFYVTDSTGRLDKRMFWNDILIYANIIEGLHAYRREISDNADSVGIDAWGTDGILINEDGVPLERMYAYRDHRLDNMIEEVKNRVEARRIYDITGVNFHPFNLSNQLLWFVQNRGSLLKKGVRFLPVPALFAYYLGGVKQIDSTWASVTQLMDSKKKKWSRELLRGLGIPTWIMPEIVAPGTVVSNLYKPLADSVGINQAKLIAVGSHDTASAYAGAPVSTASDALIISSGTWSLVGKLIKRPITTEEAMQTNISNEGGIGNIRLLKNCMGMWLVQELRREWRKRDGREIPWEQINHLAVKGKPFTAFIDPDDMGFYNPPNMSTAIVEFCRRTGQTPPADRATMLRSVYESLALKYRMVSEKISDVSGNPNRIVHIVGGGSRNDFLNQLTANACGLRVVAGPEEATAVGNALMQAVGLGVIERLSDALPLIRSGFEINEYKPETSGKWIQAYEKFRSFAK